MENSIFEKTIELYKNNELDNVYDVNFIEAVIKRELLSNNLTRIVRRLNLGFSSYSETINNLKHIGFEIDGLVENMRKK